MFDRVRPPGGWTNQFPIDPDELETFDAALSEAIDGTGGGAYSPTELITIGGKGLKVTGGDAQALEVDGNVFFHGGTLFGITIPTVINAPFEAEQTAIFDGAVTMRDDVFITGDTQIQGGLAVTGLSVFQNIAAFNAVASFAAQVNINGELNVGGVLGANALFASLAGAEFSGGNYSFASTGTNYLDCSPPLHLHDELLLTDHGRIGYRIATSTITGPAQSATFSVNDYDIVMIGGDGVLNGDIDWVISEDGAQPGCKMILSRDLDFGAHNVFVRRSDSSVIEILDGVNNSWCTIVRTTSGWKRLMRGGVAAT